MTFNKESKSKMPLIGRTLILLAYILSKGLNYQMFLPISNRADQNLFHLTHLAAQQLHFDHHCILKQEVKLFDKTSTDRERILLANCANHSSVTH